MNQLLCFTGGARVGSSNVTFPFATLKVDKNCLTLDLSCLKDLTFKPEDIISIEPYFLVPLIGQGIKINHRVSGYNPNVIFWTGNAPDYVLNQIRATGFLDNVIKTLSDEDVAMLKRQKQNEFAINPFAIIVFFWIWGGLFISSFLFFPFKKGGVEMVQRAVIIGLSFILVICITTLSSTKFQRLILRKNRAFSEIKKGILFLSAIIAFMLLLILMILIKY